MQRIRLEHDTLRELSAPSNLRGALDVLLTWGAIAAAIAAATAVGRHCGLWHWGTWAAHFAAVVFIGSRQNALATLAHEAWHGLTFSSRRLNHLVGAWCYAYPIAIPYEHDRRRHLRHHREVGHDHDPDWINYTSDGRETPGRVLWYLLSLLCGRMVFGTLWRLLVDRKPRISNTDGQDSGAGAEQPEGPSPLAEYLRAGLVQLVLLTALTLTVGWWGYLVFWALPVATFAGFFANYRALIEHVAPDDDAAEPDERLRDFAVGPVEALLISPNHFHYHALHHQFPSVPHYRLPRCKRVIEAQEGEYPLIVWPGYTAALLQHLASLPREEAETPEPAPIGAGESSSD